MHRQHVLHEENTAMHKWIFVPVAFLLTAVFAASISSAHTFSLPSTDRLASINGIIDYPPGLPGRKPTAVLLVGGTNATRDGSILYPPDRAFVAEAFWYRDLSRELVNRGFAVIRYDNRGLRSILDCERIRGASVTIAQYLADSRCYNPQAASTTTFETRRSDLAAVFAMAAKHRALDPARLIVVAHSEGAFHVAATIRDRRITPAALVMLGAAAGSPSELAQWQSVGRQYEWIEALVAQHHGYVSNTEIARRLNGDLSGQYHTVVPLRSDQGGWSLATLPQLKRQLTAQAVSDSKMVLDAPPNLPSVSPIAGDHRNLLVLASNSALQSLLTDSARVVDGLAGYRGPVSFIYGADDIVIAPKAQMHIIATSTLGGGRTRVIELAGVNHGFSSSDQKQRKPALERIAQEIARVNGLIAGIGASP
jgi:pimeloyl-ACP methyl ester carboxylesterase